MIYVYDIILNWTDEDRVYDFFEWELNDTLEHIKRMPFFKISVVQLSKMICYDFKVNSDFLAKINDLTEVYTNEKTEKIPYAALFTDGVRMLAIEFDTNGFAIYRSKMLLDEEQDALMLSNKMVILDIPIETKRKRAEELFVTRFENEIRKILNAEIQDSYKKGNTDKLKYLYYECFGKRQDNIEIIYEQLLKSINKEINYSHNKLYEVIKLSYQNKS